MVKNVTRNVFNNQDHRCNNEDLQNYQGHPEVDSNLGIPGREKKNGNLKTDNNAKSCAGTTKCH